MSRVVLSIYDDVANPHYGGGGAVMASSVAGALSSEHDVLVVTGGYRGSGLRSTRDGVPYLHLPVGWAGPRGGQLLFHLLLPGLALVLRHDVWIESFTPPFSTSLLPLVTRAPVIGWAQMLSGSSMSLRYHLPFWRYEGLGLRVYRHLVAVNHADAEVLRSASPRAEVHEVPNGLQLGPPPAEDLPRGGHILFLGRIDVEQKGLDLLVQAHQRTPGALPLVIAGAGTAAEEAKLDALLRGTTRISRTGWVCGAQKAALLSGCRFLVLPSRTEAFGLSALEALAAGRPVVAFDLPQLEWLRGGVSALVPAYDVEALSDQLRRWSLDPEDDRGTARRARAHAEEYSDTLVAERFRAVVASVLGDRGARGAGAVEGLRQGRDPLLTEQG